VRVCRATQDACSSSVFASLSRATIIVR
jgi:hypothetical protein